MPRPPASAIIARVRNKLYLIGYPLGHSLSPQIHNSQFAAMKLPLEYSEREIPPGDFSESLRAMIREEDFLGANVTLPYKQMAALFMDELEGDAAALDAVNTIVRRADGKLVGHNTDVQGFAGALHSVVKTPVKRALIFGSGGAALAVLYALAQAGCERLVVVHRSDRNLEAMRAISSSANKRVRMVKLAHFEDFFGWAESEHVFLGQNCLDANCGDGLMQEEGANGHHVFNEAEFDKGPRQFDLLVNATPVGLFPKADESLGDHPRFLRLFKAVFDLACNPLETRLLFLAKLQGCEAINGRKMLERQAELSRRIWLREYKPQRL